MILEKIHDQVKLEYVHKHYPELRGALPQFDELMSRALPMFKRSQYSGKYAWLVGVDPSPFGIQIGERIVKEYFIEIGQSVSDTVSGEQGDCYLNNTLIEIKSTRFASWADRLNMNQVRKTPEMLYLLAFTPEPELRSITKDNAKRYCSSGNPSEAEHFQMTVTLEKYRGYFDAIEGPVQKKNAFGFEWS